MQSFPVNADADHPSVHCFNIYLSRTFTRSYPQLLE